MMPYQSVKKELQQPFGLGLAAQIFLSLEFSLDNCDLRLLIESARVASAGFVT
jgi:hypothetical protein